MPSQSVEYCRPDRILDSESVTTPSCISLKKMFYKEKIKEPGALGLLEKPIVTNTRGMYPGYQRFFLAYGN